MDDQPWITAVMITGKAKERQSLAKAAVRSFLLQTYPNKDLLIINDSKGTGHEFSVLDAELQQVAALLGNPIMHEEHVEYRSGRTLGELRNLGLLMAQGDWIAQWDDDDWSHPVRLQRQMSHAKPDRAIVLGYQVRYNFKQNSAYVYINKRDGIAGTILHPRTDVRYQSLSKAEDSAFLKAMFKPGVHKNSDWPHLYLRFFHDTNTWDEAHVMQNYHHPGWKNRWADVASMDGFLPEPAVQYLAKVLQEQYGTTFPKLPWDPTRDSIESNPKPKKKKDGKNKIPKHK